MIVSQIIKLIREGTENNIIMSTLLQMKNTYQDIFKALSNNDREMYFGGSTVFYINNDMSEDEMNIHEWFDIALNRVRKELY